jgi:nucleotide-binding universal stress UspA family protein
VAGGTLVEAESEARLKISSGGEDMTTSPTLAGHAGERRVVVGVSGSKASLAALMAAAVEAKLRHAVLQVVSVDEPPPPRAPYAPPHETEAAPSTEDDFVRGTTATLTPDVAVTYQRLHGPASRMLQLAARDAELLVIGRTDYADVIGPTQSADMIGPTARACVAHAACPVLVVSSVREEVSATTHVPT